MRLRNIKNAREGLGKSLNRKKYKHIQNLVVLTVVLFSIVNPTFGQVRLGLGNNGSTLNRSNDIELSYANPREYEIATIEVKGLETLDKNALISLSGLKVGDKIRIPSDVTSGAIKKLWKSGIIGNVSIYISKVEGDKANLLNVF